MDNITIDFITEWSLLCYCLKEHNIFYNLSHTSVPQFKERLRNLYCKVMLTVKCYQCCQFLSSNTMNFYCSYWIFCLIFKYIFNVRIIYSISSSLHFLFRRGFKIRIIISLLRVYSVLVTSALCEWIETQCV